MVQHQKLLCGLGGVLDDDGVGHGRPCEVVRYREVRSADSLKRHLRCLRPLTHQSLRASKLKALAPLAAKASKPPTTAMFFQNNSWVTKA